MKSTPALVLAALAALSGNAFSEEKAAPVEDRPVVQLAILLDNSGSMNGLIGQAKTQLWNIVNEFISAKQDGKSPRVQVALFEYGVNDRGVKSGYIRKLSDLTDDLDKLSEQLFAINPRHSGSNEYCGQVLQEAVETLAWNPSAKIYKAVFIAGNEPFTQGPVPYASACREAIKKGIIVNTIHCGSHEDGVSGKWQDAAALADGKYLVINHNAAVAAIAAPQDKEIAELSSRLNSTYVAYGRQGGASKARQEAQDANAATVAPAAAPEVIAQRALSKASANYYNAQWDLVDRAKEKDFDLAKVPEAELPAEMQKLSVEERKAYLDKKTAERAELQKKISELGQQRATYIAEKSKEQAKDSTLGAAVTTAVREQAQQKGVTFEK
jgi:hypothetical protein